MLLALFRNSEFRKLCVLSYIFAEKIIILERKYTPDVRNNKKIQPKIKSLIKSEPVVSMNSLSFSVCPTAICIYIPHFSRLSKLQKRPLSLYTSRQHVLLAIKAPGFFLSEVYFFCTRLCVHWRKTC